MIRLIIAALLITTFFASAAAEDAYEKAKREVYERRLMAEEDAKRSNDASLFGAQGYGTSGTTNFRPGEGYPRPPRAYIEEKDAERARLAAERAEEEKRAVKETEERKRLLSK